MPGLRKLIRERINRFLGDDTPNVRSQQLAEAVEAATEEHIESETTDEGAGLIPSSNLTQDDLQADLDYHEDRMEHYLNLSETIREVRNRIKRDAVGESRATQLNAARKARDAKLKEHAALQKYRAHADLAETKRLIDTVLEIILINQGAAGETRVNLEEEIEPLKQFFDERPTDASADTTPLEVRLEDHLPGDVVDGFEEELQDIQENEIDDLEETNELLEDVLGDEVSDLSPEEDDQSNEEPGFGD
jgi:hypothetical protein